MMSEAPKQLNAFEIKREISRIVKALEKSTILIDTAEFKTLDEQKDTLGIVKILLKEFYLCNEETLPVIKLLLLRYADEKHLLNELEAIIKNPENENNIKLHAIELISSFKPDWHDENYDTYLVYDEELVQQETKELLESSKDNPEIQLDFLDFFSAIPPKDQMMLLESLEDDQHGEDLANILVPIFLSFPKDEIGLCALKMLSTTKSPFAYQSLLQVSNSLDESVQQNIKKCLTELKLSGAGKNNSTPDAHKKASFFIIPPDGEGNVSLIYMKHNDDNKSVMLIGLVIDEYTGIRECLGFSAISEFEASFLLEKLTGADFKTTISPEIFKMLMLKAETINYQKSAPPYEYNCWKRIFLDITPAELDIEDFLIEKFDGQMVTDEEIKEALNADFTVPWFYTRNFGDETEQFFNELDKLIKADGIENINIENIVLQNIDKVIYEQEKQNWKQRILLTSFTKFNDLDEKTARTLFKIAEDKSALNELYIFILRQSIFQYFLNMAEEECFLKYRPEEVEENLAYLEQLWGFYV